MAQSIGESRRCRRLNSSGAARQAERPVFSGLASIRAIPLASPIFPPGAFLHSQSPIRAVLIAQVPIFRRLTLPPYKAFRKSGKKACSPGNTLHRLPPFSLTSRLIPRSLLLLPPWVSINCRAITSLRISLVPSPIAQRRASRKYFSAGFPLR